MSDHSSELLALLRKIHGLLELLAEEKIAQRDAKLHAALLEIVGASAPRQRAVRLMDGTRTQADIHRAASMNKGNLSTMVGKLHATNLLLGDIRKPQLAIPIPAHFFEDPPLL